MGIWYDLFIILVVFGGMLFGFSIGTVRQLFNIGALYFGLVFAAYNHPTITRWARNILGNSESLIREALLFFLVFTAIWLFINAGAYISFRTPPRFLPATLDRLVGMLLGIITGLLAIVVITLLLNYATSVEWPRDNALRLAINQAIEASALRPIFSSLLPAIASTINPLLPRGLPSFFLQDL